MNQEIRVVAVGRVKPEFLALAQKAILECVKPSRAEAGCLEYTAHLDTAEEGRFVFVERWKSKDDLGLHASTPHFKKMMEAVAPLLKSEFEVQILKEI